MDAVRDFWNDLNPLLARFIAVAVILIGAVIVQRLVARGLRRAYERRLERSAEARDVSELGRVKRQQTLVTTVESTVRYGIYGAAIIVSISMLSGGRSSALFSASVVAVLVGFSIQRLLADVVAGALLLFEGHYAVGDVVTAHTQNVTGTVEQFQLRTTTLRTLGGDKVTILNGAMTTFTRWSYSQREFRVELVVRSAEATEAVRRVVRGEAAASTALWVRPPEVTATEHIEAEFERVVITVVVAPGHEVLVDRLASLLEAAAGDGEAVGPASVVSVYMPAFEAWRAGVLVRQ